MKKINKKGMTITEIIVSVTLVSIVLVFLFNMLIAVRNEDATSQSESKLLINQSLIIKEIENDFIDYELQNVSICSYNEFKDNLPTSTDPADTFYCLKFIYNPNLIPAPDNIGYLLYYTYKYSNSVTSMNVVGYKRGDNKVIRETELAPNATPVSNIYPGTVKLVTNGPDKPSALRVDLPIKGADGEDYGINLSYIGNVSLYYGYDSDHPAGGIYGFKIPS